MPWMALPCSVFSARPGFRRPCTCFRWRGLLRRRGQARWGWPRWPPLFPATGVGAGGGDGVAGDSAADAIGTGDGTGAAGAGFCAVTGGTGGRGGSFSPGAEAPARPAGSSRPGATGWSLRPRRAATGCRSWGGPGPGPLRGPERDARPAEQGQHDRVGHIRHDACARRSHRRKLSPCNYFTLFPDLAPWTVAATGDANKSDPAVGVLTCSAKEKSPDGRGTAREERQPAGSGTPERSGDDGSWQLDVCASLLGSTITQGRKTSPAPGLHRRNQHDAAERVIWPREEQRAMSDQESPTGTRSPELMADYIQRVEEAASALSAVPSQSKWQTCDQLDCRHLDARQLVAEDRRRIEHARKSEMELQLEDFGKLRFGSCVTPPLSIATRQ